MMSFFHRTTVAVVLAGILHVSAFANMKVGFIYAAPALQDGWYYQHDLARKAVEKTFNGEVTTVVKDGVPEAMESVDPVVHAMDEDGVRLIFLPSFGYPAVELGERYPHIRFEHATGYKRRANVATYSGRFYQGRAVTAYIAAGMTKSNRIGYVASFPIPEVIRGINAAFLEAKKMNPNVEFDIVWSYTWFDPQKEYDLAKQLIQRGADVIMQHTDSIGPVQAAKDLGVYAVGQASDMSHVAPQHVLTSVVDDWSDYYIQRVRDVKNNTWKSQDYWGGLGEVVQIAPVMASVPESIQVGARELGSAIVSGKQHVFVGPIFKQDGSVWLKEGEIASDSDLLTMQFYVKGIKGTIPSG